jgi:hypothetical protein
MITAEAMVEMLKDAGPGSVVFVSYAAGRPPKPRAVREAMKADHEGYPKRWFLGRLESKWTTKSGDPVITVFTTTRYNEDKPEADGHYRTLNPRLGHILALEVVQAVAPEAVQ